MPSPTRRGGVRSQRISKSSIKFHLQNMSTAENIAKILLNIKAVTLNTDTPYTWNTGLKSPIYCDNRLLMSHPKERKEVVEGYKQLIRENNIEFDVIAGTATAGIAWAAYLAYDLGKPMVFVRANPKDYGLAKKVEGRMERGARVLIVEDLISTGRSSLASATACREEYNANIVAVLSIFTYEMNKSKSAFQEANIPLHSLSNFSTLVNIATQEQYLSSSQKRVR